MTNEEIDRFMSDRTTATAEGMTAIGNIKGSTATDGMLTAIASILQTIALLLAEQVKRMPEPGIRSAEETVNDAIKRQGW